MRITPGSSPSKAMHAIHVQQDAGSQVPSKSRNSSARLALSGTFLAKPEYVDEVVALGFSVRMLIWSTIVFLMLFNGALLSVWAFVYVRNDTRDSLLFLFRTYFLFSDGNAFLQNWSTTVAAGYAVLAAVFLVLVVRILWLSIRKREFELSNRVPTTTFQSDHHKLAAVRHLTSAYDKLHHLFGVRGAYFELRLLTEEWIEMTMMTLAAHSASSTISKVPLNLIFGIVIFINGISSIVIRRVFRGSLIKQRIACLLADLVIDFIWGTLLPMWMYVPILKIYMDRANVLDYIANFANSTREVERVLILSWRYYLLSVIPFINSLSNLVEVESILRKISPQSSRVAGVATEGTTFIHLVHPVGRCRHGPLVRLAHLLMPVYGLGVLLTVLAANGVFKSPPSSDLYTCVHPVHPWFSTKEACLGRHINCTTVGISGTATELAQAMETFDESSLADLFLLSCPHLEVPTKIHDFHRLMTIVVLDSTLVEWSEDAALTAEYYAELRTVQMIWVTLVQDPLGLVGARPISSSVEWIHLENVNAADLIPKVGDKWKGLLFFDCMNCGLATFPAAMLSKMPRLTMLSLWVNDIDTVPNEWLESVDIQLQAIWFGANPRLTALPDSLWRQSATIGVFAFEETNLSVVPAWVADVAGPAFLVNAIDTPVCTGAAPLDPRVQQLVTCA